MIQEVNYSIPIIKNKGRHNRVFSENRNTSEINNLEKSKSPYAKLPVLQISKILRKIGAGDRNKQMFVPN